MEKVILGKNKYELIHNEDGTEMLRRYHPKFKMWTEMVYDPKSDLKPLEKVKEILINNYIESVTGVKTFGRKF
jgi:hypothetical protein